jgi:hypothetical protein
MLPPENAVNPNGPKDAGCIKSVTSSVNLVFVKEGAVVPPLLGKIIIATPRLTKFYRDECIDNSRLRLYAKVFPSIDTFYGHYRIGVVFRVRKINNAVSDRI